MANWTVSQGTVNASTGVVLGTSNIVDLTISNINSGYYNLAAENFKVGGASESSTNTWAGGNVDSQVDYVVFSTNVDTSGNSLNTVNARVHLKSYVSFTADTTVYVDIDEKTSNAPATSIQRNVCLTTMWGYTVPSQVSFVGSGYTYAVNDPVGAIPAGTLLDNGVDTFTPATGVVSFKHNGTVDSGSQYLVVDITFTRQGAKYFKGYAADEQSPSISWAGLTTNNMDYSGSYVEEITPTVGFVQGSDGDQAYTSFNVKIYYTPPSEYGPLAEEDMCSKVHTAEILFDMGKPPEPSGINVSNQINTVSFESDISSTGGTQEIVVKGSANTSYTMQVIGSGAKETYGATSYYNFVSDKFVASPTKQRVFTTNSLGKNTHYVRFPAVSSDTRYDILIGSSGSSTLLSAIPTTFGKSIVTQHGTRTLTISPTKINTGKYGTLPTASNANGGVISRRSRFIGNKYPSAKTKTIFANCAKAVTAGKTLVLTKVNNDIKPGMIVNTPFQGSGVAHLTTVAKVKGNRIVLSANATVAAGARVRFDLNNNALSPFSFTIQTGSNTLSFGAGQITSSPNAIAGLAGVVRQVVNGGVSASATVNLVDIEGVVVGMTISGPSIPVGTTVAAIDRPNDRFTASTPVTIPATTKAPRETLTFKLANPLDVALVHAHAVIDTTATLTGYVMVKDISTNVSVALLVDNVVGTD